MARQLDTHVGFYDPTKSYDDNWHQGPFLPTDNEPYANDGEPQFDFFGQKVYSPFGIGAGPLPSARHIKAAFTRGFDVVTFKSARTHTYPCHPMPNVVPVQLDALDPNKTDEPIQATDAYEDPLSVSNSFGIPSFEPEVWQPEVVASLALAGNGQALLVAFQGTDRGEGKDAFVADHVEGVKLLKETGATVIEINLSCPNEGSAELLCHNTADTLEVIKAVRASVEDIKLLVKIAYFTDKEQLKDFVRQVGPLVDGITAINTIAACVVDEKGSQRYPGGAARSKPGVSGHAIKEPALEMVGLLNTYRQELGLNYKIVGIGGVVSAADYKDMRDRGADIVMSVAGSMWNPDLAAEVKASL